MNLLSQKANPRNFCGRRGDARFATGAALHSLFKQKKTPSKSTWRFAASMNRTESCRKITRGWKTAYPGSNWLMDCRVMLGKGRSQKATELQVVPRVDCNLQPETFNLLSFSTPPFHRCPAQAGLRRCTLCSAAWSVHLIIISSMHTCGGRLAAHTIASATSSALSGLTPS